MADRMGEVVRRQPTLPKNLLSVKLKERPVRADIAVQQVRSERLRSPTPRHSSGLH